MNWRFLFFKDIAIITIGAKCKSLKVLKLLNVSEKKKCSNGPFNLTLWLLHISN